MEAVLAIGEKIRARVDVAHGDVITRALDLLESRVAAAEAMPCSYAASLHVYVDSKIAKHHVSRRLDDADPGTAVWLDANKRWHDLGDRIERVHGRMYDAVCGGCGPCKSRKKAWPPGTVFVAKASAVLTQSRYAYSCGCTGVCMAMAEHRRLPEDCHASPLVPGVYQAGRYDGTDFLTPKKWEHGAVVVRAGDKLLVGLDPAGAGQILVKRETEGLSWEPGMPNLTKPPLGPKMGIGQLIEHRRANSDMDANPELNRRWYEYVNQFGLHFVLEETRISEWMYNLREHSRAVIVFSNSYRGVTEDIYRLGFEKLNPKDRRIVVISDEHDIERVRGLDRDTPWFDDHTTHLRRDRIVAELRARFGTAQESLRDLVLHLDHEISMPRR